MVEIPCVFINFTQVMYMEPLLMNCYESEYPTLQRLLENFRVKGK